MSPFDNQNTPFEDDTADALHGATKAQPSPAPLPAPTGGDFSTNSSAAGVDFETVVLTKDDDTYTVQNAAADSKRIVSALDGNDTVIGSSGGDRLDGGAGDDSLDGGAGNDLLIGDSGDAAISVSAAGGEVALDGISVEGGPGPDQLRGTEQNDTLIGGGGRDALKGLSGNDILLGGDSQDRIVGDAGDDTINGGAGQDLLYGGLGRDVFVMDTADTADFVRDWDFRNDKIALGFAQLRLVGGGLDFSKIRALTSGDDALLQVDLGGGFITLANLRLGARGVVEDYVIDANPGPVNTAPVFSSTGAAASAENQLTTTYVAQATDAENDPITYQISGGADATRFVLGADGVLSLINAQNFEVPGDADGDGVYDLTITASDGVLQTVQSVQVTVTDANDTPEVAGPLVRSVSEADATFTLDLLEGASDEDAAQMLAVDNLMVVAGNAAGVTLSGGGLDVDPSAYTALGEGQQEIIQISYDIVDGNGGAVAQTAQITVNGIDSQSTDTTPPSLSAVLSSPVATNAPVIDVVVSDNRPGVQLLARLSQPGTDEIDLSSAVDTSGQLRLTLSELEAAIGQSVPDGIQTLSFVAVDTAGNRSSVETLRFDLDRTAPLAVSGPSGVLSTAPGRLVVEFDSAIEPGVVTADLFAISSSDGTSVDIASVSRTGDRSFTLNLTRALENGDFSLNFLGGLQDLAENEASAAQFDFSVLAPTRVVSISPEDDSRFINVDRELTVKFDRPVDASTITAETFRVEANGEPVEGFVRVSGNGLMATFFLSEGVTFPAASNVKIILDGDAILDVHGQPVDVDRDGLAGGQTETEFYTVSLTRIPGTNLEGHIFDSNRRGPDGENLPLEGVIVKVIGLPGVQATTDANGRFFLEDLPAPEVFLDFDASPVTADTGFTYGTVLKPVHTTPGETVQLALKDGTPFNMFFAAVPVADAVDIVPDTATSAGIGAFGLENLADLFPEIDASEWQKIKVTVPANALFFDDGTPATELTVLAFEPDRIPAPLPQGHNPHVVFTVMAGGAANVDGNAQIEFPNLDGLPPGARLPIMSFDHDAGKWVQTGTGVVSADGSRVVSEGESGVNTLGWKFVGTAPITTHTQRYKFDDTSSNPQVDLAILSGKSAVRATGETVASVGGAVLTVADAVDAIVPDEVTPASGLVTGTKLAVGLAADIVDDGSIDPAGQATSLTLAGVGSIPGASVVADGTSALVNAKGTVQNVNDAIQAGLTVPTAAFQAATTDSSSSNWGDRATDILENGAVGPSGAQIRNGVTPTPVNGPATFSLRSLDAANAPALDPVQQLAQQVIDDYHATIGDDVNDQFREEIAGLKGLLTDSTTSVVGAVTDIGLKTRVDVALSGLSNILTTFVSATAAAEDNFLAAAAAIWTSSRTTDERVLDFIAARDDYLEAYADAIATYGAAYRQQTDAIDVLLFDTYQHVLGETGAFADALNAFADFGLQQFELLADVRELMLDLLAAAERLDDLSSFSAPLHDIQARFDALDAALAASGFASFEEWGESLIAEGQRVQQANVEQVIPFGSSINPVFAQAILADGTVIRARLERGETFSVNGVDGTEATIRFFDPATNLFSESTITFGSENTEGQSLLTRILTVDTDGDGIPDLGEEVMGTNAAIADSDGDGLSDGQEARLGTSATSGNGVAFGVISGVDLPGPAVDLVVAEDIFVPGARKAYVATGSHGIAIVDVATAKTPLLAGAIDLPGSTNAIALLEGRLYGAAGAGGLHIVDITDPTRPFLARTVLIEGGADAVAVANGFALVGGLEQLSLLDPVTGTVIDQVALGGRVEDIFVLGNTLYTVESSVLNKLLKVRTFDVGPGELTELDSVDLPSPPVRLVDPERIQLFVDDGVAYVSMGIEVRAVSPFRPLERGGYYTVDVENPSQISLISEPDTGDNQAANYQTVTNGAGLGLVAGGTFGLQLFDTDNPQETFQPITDIPVGTDIRSVAISNGLAFVGDADGQLFVVNYITEGAGGSAPTISMAVLNTDADAVADGLQLTEGTRVALDVQATDDVQVNAVSLFVNGQRVQGDVAAPFDLSFVLPELTSETTSVDIYAEAVDAAGNITRSETTTIQIVEDVTPPSIISIAPADGESVKPTNQIVSILFSKQIDVATLSPDSLLLVGSVDTLRPDGASVANLDSGQQLVRFSFLRAGEGAYTLRFDPSGVTDSAGNEVTGGVVQQSLGVFAFSDDWIADVSGLWSDGANWRTGSVPGGTDFVRVDLDAGVVATVDAVQPAILSVQLDGAGTLLVNASRSSDTALTMSALENLGTASLDRGRLLVTGEVTNAGLITIRNEGSMRIDGDLVNSGLIRVGDGVTSNASLLLSNELMRLTGGGTIDLDDPFPVNTRPDNVNGLSIGIRGVIDQTLENVDNTISGTGGFGRGFVLVNGEEGRIVAHDGDHLVLTTGQLTNNGVIQAEAGGRITFDSGQFFSAGFLGFRGATFVQNHDGVIRADGGVIDLFDATIRGGQLVTTDVGTNLGEIRIGSDGAANGFATLDAQFGPLFMDARLFLHDFVYVSGFLGNSQVTTIEAGAYVTVTGGLFLGNQGEFLLGGTDEFGQSVRIVSEVQEFDAIDEFGEIFTFRDLPSINITDTYFHGGGLVGREAEYVPEEIFDEEGNPIIDMGPPADVFISVLGLTEVVSDDPTTPLTFAHAVFYNESTVRTAGGDMMFDTIGFDNLGTVTVDGNSMVFVDNTFENPIFRSISNQGTWTVENGGYLEIGYSMVNFGNVNIVSGTADFIGELLNFGGGRLRVGDADVFFRSAVEGTVDLSLGDADVIIGDTGRNSAVFDQFEVGDALHLDVFSDASAITFAFSDNLDGTGSLFITEAGTSTVEILLAAPSGGFLIDVASHYFAAESAFGGVAITTDYDFI